MIWLFIFWILGMIIGIFLIGLIFVLAVQNHERNKEKKKREMRIDCIKKSKGVIIETKQENSHTPLILTIEFQANQKTYQFDEKALLIVEKVKWKGIPVDKKEYYPFDVTVGSIVDIKYNPKDPHIAYIVDNVGAHTTVS